VPRSTSQLRALWGPVCNVRTSTVALFGTGQVTVDYRIVPAVYALNRCLIRHGYRTIYAQTGAYVCRRRRLPSGGFASDYSLHAYAIALDLNWQQNGFGRSASHNIPAALVADIEAIRTNNGAQVWYWGGHFSTPDYMHFQVCASPAELANGIASAPAPSQDEELTMDAEARAAFTAVEKQNSEQLAWMLRMEARIEELEKDRWKPTTTRVRKLAEKAGITD
jgi:hypothetical protein